MNKTAIRWARRVFVPVGIFSALLCVLVAALLALQFACGHPSDARLAKQFYAHESEFIELVHMAETDFPVYRIAFDFSFPENRLSAHRWNDYRARFDRLGISKGISKPLGGDYTMFMASTEGLLFNRGSSKGYVFSQSQLRPCVSDIDLESYEPPLWAAENKLSWIVYKPLKEHWYLYYEFR